MRLLHTLLGGIGAVALLASAAPVQAQANLQLAGLPYQLQQNMTLGSVVVDKAGFTLSATKGSDLYTNADGSKRADATPRLLFTPVGDFIISVRVGASFHAPFDGAALIVYADGANWAKLLFEQARSGGQGVSSTVSKGVGDDAHHGMRAGGAVYLKLARRDGLYVFYTSQDGQTWQMVRNFGLPAARAVQVGFSAQSPLGEQFTAQFSELRFRAAAFKDFWQGE